MSDAPPSETSECLSGGLSHDGSEAIAGGVARGHQTRSLTDLLNRIVAHCQNPARLLELYYWSAEPELAEVMRHYLALPTEARSALHTFLSLSASDPGSVTIRAVQSGELILSSQAAAELPEQVARHGTSSTAAH
jgi:hypothetical protein